MTAKQELDSLRTEVEKLRAENQSLKARELASVPAVGNLPPEPKSVTLLECLRDEIAAKEGITPAAAADRARQIKPKEGIVLLSSLGAATDEQRAEIDSAIREIADLRAASDPTDVVDDVVEGT